METRGEVGPPGVSGDGEGGGLNEDLISCFCTVTAVTVVNKGQKALHESGALSRHERAESCRMRLHQSVSASR